MAWEVIDKPSEKPSKWSVIDKPEKRAPSLMEFGLLSTGKYDVPENIEFTPFQAGLLGLKGGVESTGYGLSQLIGKAIPGEGGKKFEEAATQLGSQSRGITKKAVEQQPWAAIPGEVVGALGASAPLSLVGGGAGTAAVTSRLPGVVSKAAPYLGTAAKEGLFGAAQHVDPEESRLANAAIFGTLGAGAHGIADALSKGGSLVGKKLFGSRKPVEKEIVEPATFSPEYKAQLQENIAERRKALEEMGVPDFQLTPAEAMGSPSVAQKEAQFGHSEKTKGRMEEFWLGKGGRYAQENKLIDDIYKEMGVDPKNIPTDTSRKVRDTAKEIFDELVEKRQAESSPYYKAADKEIVPKKTADFLMTNEIIKEAASDIPKKATRREAVKAMKPNSIAYFDLIKKNIDSNMGIAKKVGDNEEAKLLLEAKKQLTEILDNISPAYKKARSIFADESTVINELKNTNLSKLSNLDDSQLSKVSNILFNKKEIDPKTLAAVRGRLFKQNPKTYYDALAQDMLDKSASAARIVNNRKLPGFYSGVLQKDAAFNNYKEALKYNPAARKRLENMRKVFKDMAPTFTPKSSRALEATGMLGKRDSAKTISQWIDKFVFDEVGVDYILNPKWEKQAKKLLGSGKAKSMNDAILQTMIKAAEMKAIEKKSINQTTDQ